MKGLKKSFYLHEKSDTISYVFMKKISTKSLIVIVQWVILVVWGVVVIGSKSNSVLMKIYPAHTLFPLAMAGLGVLQYYLSDDEEQLKALKRIPYLMFVGLLLWVFIRWEKRTYLEPRVKQIIEQNMEK